MRRDRLFVISCLALITTAVAFSVRGDVLDALGTDFHINHAELGVLLGPAFWGQTIAILLGGSLVDYFGMRRLLQIGRHSPANGTSPDPTPRCAAKDDRFASSVGSG